MENKSLPHILNSTLTSKVNPHSFDYFRYNYNILNSTVETVVQFSGSSTGVYSYRYSNLCDDNENIASMKTLPKKTPPEMLIGNNFKVEGRRIINFSCFMDQLKKISVHKGADKFGCLFTDISIVSERKNGLNSTMMLKCTKCNKRFSLYTCEPPNINDTMGVNYSGVLGTLLVGNGYSQYNEFLANLTIPSISGTAYKKLHDKISIDIQETAHHCMKVAAEEEKQIARGEGKFDDQGEIITVVTDGCWSKRSYGNSYNALSGSATIIGHKTNKVLWSSIRNKYCLGCAKGTKHICHKNFSGSSTGMESDILVDGFRKSLELYGLKYLNFIGDGDSSVHTMINKSFPYREKVSKVECRNHLLRNLRKKVKELATNTRYNISGRKKFTAKNKQICRAIYSSINHWKSEINLTLEQKIVMLEADINNIPRHIFGNHLQCADYFSESCNKEETNIYDEIRFDKTGIFEKITSIIKSVSCKANSLIFDADSNIVEQFHNVVAKYVGGKRINFSLSNSYETRTYAAIIQHNTGAVHSEIHKQVFKVDSSELIQKLENDRINHNNMKKISRKRKIKLAMGKKDKNYGTDSCLKVELTDEEFARAKLIFLDELNEQQDKRKQIYKNTTDQSNSSLWNDIRKKLITSSNFGVVCKRKKADCTKLVKSILYQKTLNTAAINHGKLSEKLAIKKLEETLNIKVDSCGLVIDSKYSFIGSSPDGLIDTDGIVEIKCPYTAFGMDVDEGIYKII